MPTTLIARRFALRAYATLAMASTALAGDVITVSALGPADFAQIQPAIDAASEGDTILVKSGTYAPFTIDAKGVQVVEDTGADVTITDTIRVQNLGSANRVVLSGLRVTPPMQNGTFLNSGLLAQSNAGALRVFDCELFGGAVPDAACGDWVAEDGKFGAQVLTSSNVALAQCELRGGNGGDHPCTSVNSPGTGGRGLHCSSSTIATYSSSIVGGDAGHGGDFQKAGGIGAALESSSSVFAAACEVLGGVGSVPGRGDCFGAGTGGAGADVLAGSSLRRLGGLLAGGSGGISPCLGPWPSGAAFTGAGSLSTIAGTPIELDAAHVVREGQTIALSIHADPGDSAYLFESDETVFEEVPAWRGILLVERMSPTRIRKLGVVPASGTLVRTYHAGHLPSGVQSKVRYLQIYRIRGDGVTLGGFVPLTIVDAAL